ncbi:MAG TPA: type II toxin-antitoxin system HicA family toxin [Segetibacter sp.]|jgi:predicted RNA binding protein YcfA (HicA-like mRNA interferase family)
MLPFSFMGTKQIVLSGKELIKVLEKIGFVVTRINGSHHRLKHDDGRVTTIPVLRNEDLPKGLLRKIVREDLQMLMEEFEDLCK